MAQRPEQTVRRLNDLMAVSEVGRKLASILDLNELLVQVVDLICSRFGYYHVQVFLVDREPSQAGLPSDRAWFTVGCGQALHEKWPRLAYPPAGWRRERRSALIGREGIIGWVAEHGPAWRTRLRGGDVLLANDVSAEPRYIPDDPSLLPETRAELAVPLIIGGAVIGVLDVQSTQVGAFDDEDVFVLRTLADQVAVAVNSAWAYEQQREEAWTTMVMLQVARGGKPGGRGRGRARCLRPRDGDAGRRGIVPHLAVE